MSAPRGRTYRIQVDVFAEEHVTILESGDFVLEDAVTGDYVAVASDQLESFARTDPPYTSHIAECIRRELLDDTHDHCGWDWTQQPESGWWYRAGQCPTCSTKRQAAQAQSAQSTDEQRHVYAVHYVWVDLMTGDQYGKRATGVYSKAIAGTAARAPVGVWSVQGRGHYVPGFEPASDLRNSLRRSLEELTIETVVEQWDARHGTWGDGWGITRSSSPGDEVLQALYSAFIDGHPPVGDGRVTDEPSQPTSTPALEANKPPEENHVAEHRPADRFVVAQSWWIASELIRRHPGLFVHESHPGGGMYDCLTLLTAEAFKPLVQINRAGSIQVCDDPDFSVRWDEVMRASSPHAVVKQIEAAAGLQPPARTPASTRKSLAYRFIAAALNATVNDRHEWDARNEFIDTADWWPGDAELHGYLEQFPQAIDELKSTPPIGLWHEPQSHFWALLRAGKPVALVSIEGKVYLRDRVIDLYSSHASGVSRYSIIAKALADFV